MGISITNKAPIHIYINTSGALCQAETAETQKTTLGLLEEVQKQLTREALPGNRKVCTVCPAALGESIGDVAALALAMTE